MPQDATGIRGIDELVNKFIEAEEKNYSLFNYVNTLASDIEKMEQDVAGIKKEVETYKGHGVHSDSQRKQCVNTLLLAKASADAPRGAGCRGYD